MTKIKRWLGVGFVIGGSLLLLPVIFLVVFVTLGREPQEWKTINPRLKAQGF